MSGRGPDGRPREGLRARLHAAGRAVVRLLSPAGLFARLRSLWRGLTRRSAIEGEMLEEFRHHLSLRTEELIRRGVPAGEAARRARLEFGHVEGLRDDARAARSLGVFDRLGFSWIDAKLGVRMLVKHPGLSAVSVIGMAIAMAIGGGGFGFIHALVDAPLPLDEGERIVAIQNSDARQPGNPDRQALHDFVVWRDEVASLRDVAAFRTDNRSLEIPGAGTAHVRVASMTASGFRVARVPPALGRPLLEDDERAGAAPVLVIAHEEWQRRFAADPSAIGRAVRLDTTVHTVVGVMPEGFRFPVNHRYWVPLRLDPTEFAVGGGPAIEVFGRLADGATLEQAQAELTTVGRRLAAANPETHEHLRPWVRPYTHPFAGIDSPAQAWLVRTLQVGLSLLLVVVAVNVAILMYARTAARTGEIAVRTALGASRRRILGQLFAEALVLSVAATILGLAVIGFGLDPLIELVTEGRPDELPFWIDPGITPALVAYAALLAILAAVIVGLLPGLKATAGAVQGSLQRLASRGSTIRLGRTWATLIVVQVAVAVAVLPYALWGGSVFSRSAAVRPDYPIDRFLQTSVALERPPVPPGVDSAAHDAAMATRFAASVEALRRRLEAEPSVAGVAFASNRVGSETYAGKFEVDGEDRRIDTWASHVDVGLFDVFDVPILAGRAFTPADRGDASNPVIVDRAFADEVAAGGHPIGRRIRRLAPPRDGSAAEPGPWLEIVGVVPSFTPPPPFQPDAPKLFLPLGLDAAERSGIDTFMRATWSASVPPSSVLHLAVRLQPGAAPASFLGRPRALGLEIDPALRFTGVATAAEADRLVRRGFFYLAVAIVAITGSVLLLSGAGIYALMSFTVASRRHEIGIRTALGAAPRRVLADVFKRASAQLGAGVLAGLALAEAVPRVQGGSFFAGEGMVNLAGVVAIILAIGLLAALGPARRGLSIQPTEALREE